MQIVDGRVVVSASDLAWASECELDFAGHLDTLLGRTASDEQQPDPMGVQLAQLGASHEKAQLDAFRAEFGDDGVRVIGRPAAASPAYDAAREATLDALRSGVPVVAQACLWDGSFVGFADFLVRRDDWSPERPSYEVIDAKLARHAKVTALLQLAAYAEQLRKAGIEPGPDVTLVLGDGRRESYPLAEIASVHDHRRARLDELVRTRVAADSPIRWGDAGVSACGRCERCLDEVRAHRDVLLVARMRADQRKKLSAAGITTIDELAARTEPVASMKRSTFEQLRAQARLQVRACPPDGSDGGLHYELLDTEAITRLPHIDEGDIFFDFEGDPLWSDAFGDLGLEYLFGVLETDGTFRPFWAHNRQEERQALLDFLDYLTERRARFPGMHVYHYAAYERTALLRLAARHGVGEAQVDDLLRDAVLVDLYAVVRKAIRVSQPSYSIKKLEPFYMGDDLRSGDVTTAGDSIVEYHRWREANESGDAETAATLLNSIADYNRYDCVSTHRLRDWLLDIARDAAGPTAETEGLPGKDMTHVVDARSDSPDQTGAHDLVAAEPDPSEQAQAAHDEAERLAGRLSDLAGPRDDRDPDEQALAMISAAAGFHRREAKQFWWAHFDRLLTPVADWDVGVEALPFESVQVVQDWHLPARKKNRRRVLRARVAVDPNVESSLDRLIHRSCFVVYEHPGPPGSVAPSPAHKVACAAQVLAVHLADTDNAATAPSIDNATERYVTLDLEETLQPPVEEHALEPVGLTECPPPYTTALERSLLTLAERAERDWPELPPNPAVELLRRRPPRLRSGSRLGVLDDDAVTVLTRAVSELDHSYVAVQGPPGTGKTYVAARVIANLLETGWRIGVVGQSHAVVENVLATVAALGVDAGRIAKTKSEASEPTWTPLKDAKAVRGFVADADGGVLIGGTAWDFCGNAFDEEDLDLLVIDEAGQFSIANTLAVSRAASRLLLLGDPSQLPQVSKGQHPEPVGESALGWLAQGADVLPAELGYFLATTWRMHPDVCAAVSRLSYDGKLRSHTEVTAARSLDGVSPGVRVIRVDHHDNRTSAPEEAARVVGLVADLVGRQWSEPGEEPRPLAPTDVLVVAPYNDQVALVTRSLHEAGLGEVAVGTVDKFQGRQAVVAIVSMTSSALADMPRGADFLLSRNRLNVAISRAKWQAIIVRSSNLTDLVPRSTRQMLALGAFMRLCGDPTGAQAVSTHDQ